MAALLPPPDFEKEYMEYVPQIPTPGITYFTFEPGINKYQKTNKFFCISDDYHVHCYPMKTLEIIKSMDQFGQIVHIIDLETFDLETLPDLVLKTCEILKKDGIDFQLIFVETDINLMFKDVKVKQLQKFISKYESIPSFRSKYEKIIGNSITLVEYWIQIVVLNLVDKNLIFNDVELNAGVLTSTNELDFTLLTSNFYNITYSDPTSAVDHVKKMLELFYIVYNPLKEKRKHCGDAESVIHLEQDEDPFYNNPEKSPEYQLINYYFNEVPAETFDKKAYDPNYPHRYIVYKQWQYFPDKNAMRKHIRYVCALSGFWAKE